MVLLDTNVLVYAADIDSPFNKIAAEIRDRANLGEIEACVSLQNLSEFYSIVTSSKRVTNPLTPVKAKKEVENFLNSPFILKIYTRPSTLQLMVDLAEKYDIKEQNIYDAQIVATMLDNDVKEIITSNDTDFKKFSEIKVSNPFK